MRFLFLVGLSLARAQTQKVPFQGTSRSSVTTEVASPFPSRSVEIASSNSLTPTDTRNPSNVEEISLGDSRGMTDYDYDVTSLSSGMLLEASAEQDDYDYNDFGLPPPSFPQTSNAFIAEVNSDYDYDNDIPLDAPRGPLPALMNLLFMLPAILNTRLPQPPMPQSLPRMHPHPPMPIFRPPMPIFHLLPRSSVPPPPPPHGPMFSFTLHSSAPVRPILPPASRMPPFAQFIFPRPAAPLAPPAPLVPSEDTVVALPTTPSETSQTETNASSDDLNDPVEIAAPTAPATTSVEVAAPRSDVKEAALPDVVSYRSAP